MMTLLDLVNAFIREVGVNGGRPIAGVGVASNSPEATRIVGFVADADYRIQAKYSDWKFMWRLFAASITTGGVLPMPLLSQDGYSFRNVNRDSLWLYPGTNQAYQPGYMEWEDYRKLYQPNGPTISSNFPSAWTVAPNRTIYINSVPTTTLPYQIEGYAKPYRMRSDADVSPIIRWMSSHPMNKIVPAANINAQVIQAWNGASAGTDLDLDGRIIIARAKIIYAEIEGADEIMRGALTEFDDLFTELQAMALPGQETDQMAQADIPQTIDPCPV